MTNSVGSSTFYGYLGMGLHQLVSEPYDPHSGAYGSSISSLSSHGVRLSSPEEQRRPEGPRYGWESPHYGYGWGSHLRSSTPAIESPPLPPPPPPPPPPEHDPYCYQLLPHQQWQYSPPEQPPQTSISSWSSRQGFPVDPRHQIVEDSLRSLEGTLLNLDHKLNMLDDWMKYRREVYPSYFSAMEPPPPAPDYGFSPVMTATFSARFQQQISPPQQYEASSSLPQPPEQQCQSLQQHEETEPKVLDGMFVRKLGSTSWCRRCKIECESMEGLVIHSFTSEHQNMTMALVLGIKQNIRSATSYASSGDNMTSVDFLQMQPGFEAWTKPTICTDNISNKPVNLLVKAVISKLEATNGGTSIMSSNVEQVSYTYGSVNPSSGYVQPDLKLFPRPANLDEGPKFDEDAFDRKSFVPEDHESLFSMEALQQFDREQYADVNEESAELSYYNTPSQVLDFTCQDQLDICLKGVDVVVIPAGVSRKPDMEFDETIRTFLQGFRLPTEAQKTDCIMEKLTDCISKCPGVVAISHVEEIVLDLTEILIRHTAGKMGMLIETFTLSCSRFVEILKSPTAIGMPNVAALVKKASRNMVSTSLSVPEHTPNLLMLYSLYLLKEEHIYSLQVNSNTNPRNVELEKNIIETCEIYLLAWLERAIEEGVWDELKKIHLVLLRGSEVQMKKFVEVLVSSFWFSLSFGWLDLFPCDQLKSRVYLMLSSIFDKALGLDCGQPIRDAYMHLPSDPLELLYLMGQQSPCDPENAPFLESIMKSNCPKELEPAIRRSMVHMNFVKKQEGYLETQRSLMAFQGVGRTLGCGSSLNSQNPALGANSATAPASVSPSTGLSVDRSLPLTLIQLRLADGTRRVVCFNYQHTVGDTQVFIDSSSSGVARTYQLQTVGFPPKPCNLNVMLHSETAIPCKLLQGFQGSPLEKLVITIWDPGFKLFFL